MIELYPHVVVLSTLHPVSPQETVNIVEFYYPEDIVAFEREFVLAQRAAYMETAIEDDEIAERMDAGRRELMRRGVNETGPYQSPMEDGMRPFHEWYQRQMDDAAEGIYSVHNSDKRRGGKECVITRRALWSEDHKK